MKNIQKYYIKLMLTIVNNNIIDSKLLLQTFKINKKKQIEVDFLRV